MFSWLKDKEKISYGVVSRGNRSVLKLGSVKQNTTLTCRVEGEHGVTSKNALVSIIKKGRLIKANFPQSNFVCMNQFKITVLF